MQAYYDDAGIGYASAVIVFILNCEYNIILTWAYYYLFASFTSVLPWSNCDNEWNTETCHVDHRKITNMIGNITNYLNITAVNGNVSLGDLGITSLPTALTNETQVHINDPVTEFWE